MKPQAAADEPKAMADIELSSTATASLSDDAGTPVLTIGGELDLSSAGVVRSVAHEVLAQHPEHLVIDLAELAFMDSSGIALLLWIAQQVTRIELRRPSPKIEQLLEMTGLTDALPIAK
jgi:anti-anti-sigma factor